jgi:hypothetical protein
MTECSLHAVEKLLADEEEISGEAQQHDTGHALVDRRGQV